MQRHDLSRFLLCLFVLRRQPRSTLFPYTTLFRSGRKEAPASARARGVLALRYGGALPGRRRPPPLPPPPELQRQRPADGEDRKSTRLNSSHVEISYAVFCLKKKTITTTTRLRYE